MMRWLLWLALIGPALAQDPSEPAPDVFAAEMGAELGEGIPGLPPGPPPPADEVDDLARSIGETLRCPVCQALSVADSTSEAAVLIQRRVRELVAAGYTAQEIRDYFADKYGTWILLDPPNEGMDRLIWIGPALAFALGLGLALMVARQAGEATEQGPPPPRPSGGGDPYRDRLLAEVDDD